jgi:hypothetical protein
MIRNAADDAPTVGMAAQYRIRKLLPLHEVDYVLDVGIEGHVWKQQVRALSQAGQSGREHLVTLQLQRFSNFLPTPTTVPRSVNKYIRAHRNFSSYRS